MLNWRVLPLVLLLGTAVSSQQDARPLFHASRSELVVLPVIVNDRAGAVVNGLSSEHFLVFDNHRVQEIAFFSHDDAPVSVALVIDSSSSMGHKFREVTAATLRFAALSHPEDELFVYPFNDEVHDVFGGKPIAAADTPDVEAALHSLKAEGRTALYDAIVTAMDSLESRPLPRKVLVVMSDGGDNASTQTLDDVLKRARRSNLTIYTIGLFDAIDTDANPGVLQTLADTTGGRRFLPRSPGPLLQACEQVAREVRGAYTLSYVPPERDGRYHRVDVRAGRGDGVALAVRTRPGYLAALP